MQSAEAASRLELMRERISIPPPSETVVDDAIDAARETSINLDRDNTPDPDVADDPVSLDDKLAATGLPSNAVHWLKSNPTFLYDADQNQRLQDLHWKLVEQGHEAYSDQYFEQIDSRLNGGAVPMRDEPQMDDDAIDRATHEARRSRPPVATIDLLPRRAPVSAPPSREAFSASGYRGDRNSRITLTPAQKEAARIAGVNEVEYAKGLLRLNQEKAAGHYGGQP